MAKAPTVWLVTAVMPDEKNVVDAICWSAVHLSRTGALDAIEEIEFEEREDCGADEQLDREAAQAVRRSIDEGKPDIDLTALGQIYLLEEVDLAA